jgi:hypothetical protein
VLARCLLARNSNEVVACPITVSSAPVLAVFRRSAPTRSALKSFQLANSCSLERALVEV